MKTIHEKINFRAYLKSIAHNVKIYGKSMLSVDVNRYGVWEYNSDPENQPIYRSSIMSLYLDLSTEL